MTTQAYLCNDSQHRLQEDRNDVISENVRKRVTTEIIQKYRVQFYVHGFVHRNINLTERTNKINREVEFIIQVFLNCSTCFWRHTAHHQEFRNCNCSLWFYIRFWLPAAAMAQPSQRPATKNICKTRSCNYSFLTPDDGRCVARNMLSNYETLEQ